MDIVNHALQEISQKVTCLIGIMKKYKHIVLHALRTPTDIRRQSVDVKQVYAYNVRGLSIEYEVFSQNSCIFQYFDSKIL